MSTIVRGPQLVREQVMALYKARFPDALAVARVEWGLTAAELPVPLQYSPHEAPVLDTLPLLTLGVGKASKYKRVDIAPEPGVDVEYQVTYQCRLFAWLKRLERDATAESRDDYATVLTAVLLANQGLDASHRFRLEESTVVASYSDIQKVRGDRHVAGCSVTFDLIHTETVRRVPLGVASQIGLEATVMPQSTHGLG